MIGKKTVALLLMLLLVANGFSAEPIKIPAFTAYMQPDGEGARISEQRGVTRWLGNAQTLNWYGQFQMEGELTASVALRLESGKTSRMRLTIDGSAREVEVTGTGDSQTVRFGNFRISGAGYKRIQLESLNAAGVNNGAIEQLLLEGEAMRNAHFNLKERRNAASVHLMYPVPDGTDVEAFYCEVTAIEDPTSTFYMACGWHRGYFGMQVNSPTERRIIFSVWDSGSEEVDRNKVADENRVKLIGKGEGVFSGDFGNEGTGGHSHLKVMWKTGEVQKFFVTAKPSSNQTTVFSGYWFHPEKKDWMLISSWRAPKEGGYLKRPHSFSENFWGSNGHLPRKALYGNQWIRTPQGDWKELTTAKFSHDPTGKEDRLDRTMGVEDGRFFLRHGGFLDGFTKYGQAFERTPIGKPPEVPATP